MSEVIRQEISLYAQENNLDCKEVWKLARSNHLKYEVDAGVVFILLSPEFLKTKICNRCKENKLLLQFSNSKYTIDGTQGHCRQCKIKSKKVSIRTEEQKEANRRGNRKRSDNSFNLYLINTYNITYSKYKEILAEQKDVCKICGEDNSKSHNRRLAVDHCHETGKIRGLLCDKCNRTVGLMEDNSKNATNAAKYLRRFEN